MKVVTDERVLKFQKGLRELHQLHYTTEIAAILSQNEIRVVEHVVSALESFERLITWSDFEVTKLIDIIKSSGGEADIPARYITKLRASELAGQLVHLYANILGVGWSPMSSPEGDGDDGAMWLDWHRGPKTESVTV